MGIYPGKQHRNDSIPSVANFAALTPATGVHIISHYLQLDNRDFGQQPCCMAGTRESFSYGKKISFLCKILSLFLPGNMAAIKHLYSIL